MKKRDTKRVSLYSNLSNRRKANRDYKARRKAEYLASLPKHPVKRVLYRMHPRRFFAYWFSKEGLFMALKLAGIGLAIITLLIGILFVYYRRELAAIRPDEISKRVQSTVTKYYDRNGVLLWEDKGDGNYKLVVKSEEIAQDMKNATVAIEDKDFYKHGGFSVTGIARAAWSNATNDNGSTQGGSTLTQQLIKQVFFSAESGDRGLSGVPRKIKEVILSIQVENMYDKDQILTMYLNESPYGGRRNGVESAAEAYFGKTAKDLTLAESALLAAIPQQPGLYNPYSESEDGHAALISRQHTVLDYMAEQGYVTKARAEEAKQVAILDTIKPEAELFKDTKAPHFVQMVKSQLETKLGAKTVGEGGLIVKTTLDNRAQMIVDQYMDALFASSAPTVNSFNNGAATMIDSQTGQILAMRGSRDFTYPGYGAVNAATAFIQPGSTIKPLVYAALLKGNYGAGSIISDTAIPQSVYKTDSGQSVQNFDNKFKGSMTIRSALAQSRNITAIKAMYMAGAEPTMDTIRAMGDTSYCTNGVEKDYGLSASIGGCTAKQVEHANAFATIARLGNYKPVASILEVRNAQGQIIDQWKDSSKQAIDPQIAYELADILSDNNARAPAFGTNSIGFLPSDGVKIGGKTGTSNIGSTGEANNFWFVSFSPKVSLALWVGNNEPTKPLRGYSTSLGPTNNKIMHDVHVNVFAKDGTWKANDWFTQPAGLQRLSIPGANDLFPSWYNKAKATTGEKIIFDRVSKQKATDCTPAAAKIEITLQYITDPVTKKKSYLSTDGYDPEATDTLHKCSDTPPIVNSIDADKTGNSYDIEVNVTQGTGNHALQSITVTVDGTAIGTINASSSGTYSIRYTPTKNGTQIVGATATDVALYTSELYSRSITFN